MSKEAYIPLVPRPKGAEQAIGEKSTTPKLRAYFKHSYFGPAILVVIVFLLLIGALGSGTFYLAAIFAIYMLPALIASARYHRNQNAIAVLNIFLGWTFIGWVIALVWSFTADTK